MLPLLRFACPSCGQHISATRAQIGVTAPCPDCNAAVTVPKTSTLPPRAPAPVVRFACPSCGQHISATRDCAAVPDKTKELKKWTDDFTDARNWIIGELGGFRGEQYFAGIFDHQQNRSVFKEKGREKLDLLRFCLPDSK
jgi:predicted RNA-binding Zn-ribbon protein involved in translation (DUF1610 family)